MNTETKKHTRASASQNRAKHIEVCRKIASECELEYGKPGLPQNRAIAKDAAITGLPTLRPEDEPTLKQRRKWAADYSKGQGSIKKLVEAANRAHTLTVNSRSISDLPNPLERLRHHVSGAIERGEKEAIVATDAPEAPQQPGTADIDTALARDKAYTRKLYAETQQIIADRQAQHSPLPWHCDLNDFTILSDKVNTYGNFHVAIVARDFLEAASETDRQQAQANLRLIVCSVNSADKLAEALRKFLKKIDNITSDQFQYGADEYEREAARAALAAWESEGK